MASIQLLEPMDTSQFIFGSTTAVSGISVIGGGLVVDFGSELRLEFFGTSLTFSGLEPTGGMVRDIVAYRGGQSLGSLQPTFPDWLFTRDGLTAAYAGEAHIIQDSPGFDILRGGDRADTFVVDGAEDWVRAGAGNDRIVLARDGRLEPLPPLDLDGEGGTDTLEILGDSGTAIVDLRLITLTSVEELVLDAGLTLRVGQAQAEGFAEIDTLGALASLFVFQEQAVLNLNLINLPVDDGLILIANARAEGGTLIGHNSIASGLYGAAGVDRLFGGAGNDLLEGLGGRDALFGGAGSEELEGGAGGDTPNGGRGADELEGMGGRDLFFFGRRSGVDVVDDFRAFGPNRDKIDLTAISTITGFRDLMRDHVVVDGADLTLQLGRGASVELLGVVRADLDAGDFLFGG